MLQVQRVSIDEAVGCLSGIAGDRVTPHNIKAVMIVAFAEEELAVDSIGRLIPIVAVVAIACNLRTWVLSNVRLKEKKSVLEYIKINISGRREYIDVVPSIISLLALFSGFKK